MESWRALALSSPAPGSGSLDGLGKGDSGRVWTRALELVTALGRGNLDLAYGDPGLDAVASEGVLPDNAAVASLIFLARFRNL